MHTNYHTQHSPFGAFASFTIGLHNAPGGFAIAMGGPAAQNIYVGYRRKGSKTWNLLPFFKATQSNVASFTGEAGGKDDEKTHRLLSENEFGRVLGWASDSWSAGAFSFSILSPFDHVPDPVSWDAKQARFYTAPVLAATLGYDNSKGDEDIELIFGMNDPLQPARPLADSGKKEFCGFASGRSYGYAVASSEGIRAVQGLSVLKQDFADRDGLHRIGQESAVIVTVPRGTARVVPLSLGFHQAGVVTTGLESSYFYSQYFSNLEEVISHGLDMHADYVSLAKKRDNELVASSLAKEQQWLLAQATHSYYGSTELLLHKGRPLWVVNEGEYRMMNTFDLTVDHLFFELEWHPWAMRNALDLFTDVYFYRDSIKSFEGETADGGISFTHDMGVSNQFSPAGRSSYECWDVHGCFSQMTMEQLVNWVCCAVTYALKTGDSAWLSSRCDVLLACKQSMERRDDPTPALRDGLLKWDSSRCGTGSEITTYDSLDVSLGQARNNLYLAVKTWAAWLLLERAFTGLKLYGESKAAADSSEQIAATLCGHFEKDTGFFPAVFEKGNQSRILPAVEGLVFPLYLKMSDALDKAGRFGELLEKLGQHMTRALQPGICIDTKTGGWKISSTSHNTWFSKIAIAQHVTRCLFPEALSPAAAAADASHLGWEQSEGTAPWAMCDQIHSETGVAIGSKYYPRGVTAFLWLGEK